MAEEEPVEPVELEHLPSLEEALSWVGFKLDDISGSRAGRVEGVFVDGEDRSPTWLVIRIGRLGRRSAVPFELAAGGVERVWVPYPKHLIRSAPEVDPAAGLETGLELDLCDHFEIAAGTGRRALVESRAGGSTTSLPAR